MSSTLSSSKREGGLSLEMLQRQRAPQAGWGDFRGLCGVVVGSLAFLSSWVSIWGTCSCLLREVRSPLALQGAPRDSSRIAAGMNRASSGVEAGTSAFLSSADGYLGNLLEFHEVCQVPFRVPRGNVGFLSKHCSVKGPLQVCSEEFRGLRGVVAEA